ncbi:MAG: translation initiation factor IF-2 [Bacteroidales bacterium]|nr:translation initiation factor IF-2 [Bacteroidales bacterium]
MSIRLNKVTRDLNVGTTTLVDYLHKKGIKVEADPNTKISEEAYVLLLKEFGKGIDIDKELKKLEQIRIDREKAAAEPVGGNKIQEAVAEVPNVAPAQPDLKKSHVPADLMPRIKTVDKIDLDALNTKKSSVAEVSSLAPEATSIQNRQNIEKINAVSPVEQPKVVTPVLPKTSSDPSFEKEKQVIKPAVVDSVKKDEPKVQRPDVEHPKKEIPKITEQKPEPKKTEEVIPVVQHADQKKVEKKETVLENVEPQKVESKELLQPTLEQQKPEEKKASEPEADESSVKSDDVYKIDVAKFENKINVVGRIDLDTINQQTRPKKKTKEERRKERDTKEKDRLAQRKPLLQPAKEGEKKVFTPKTEQSSVRSTGGGVTESNDPKKKRKRINKERVDIEKSVGILTNTQPRSATTPNTASSNNNASHKNNRFKKPVKVEVNEGDVQKQIKDTLARLTNKGKGKGVKHRRDKRDANYQRMAEQEEQELQESKTLKITEFVTANDLARMMDIPVVQVISTCMSIGMMVSINQRLDAETINIVAEEFGFKTEYVSAVVAEAIQDTADAEEDLESRPPIVTVMGHVDHGKTSLLDYIRKANVIAGEAGGITQHIGAYNVKLEDGRRITFLDTPGHEAFTAMRARGAKVTDIAIIIVAADDNVMPQTKEAINHASAAGVPIIFAINKIDKPTANPEKIKEELAGMNYLVEDWGGKYQSQDISAKKGLGVKELLEKVLLEAEMLELKANPNRNATGSIIESTLDKGRGYVATVLVSNGTLKVGDIVLAGTNFGKVKAMFNERNQRIKQAGPSAPALVLGLNGAPTAGDTFHVIETEQEAREIANKREQLQREQGLRTQKLLTLDEVGRRIALGNFQELNVIVKGDVDGSIEALSDSLIKLSTPELQVNVIHKAVGQISESDVSLAAASEAIIIGFQVRPSAQARRQAEQDGVDIRMYSVIYDAIEEVKSAMEGMLSPEIKEEVVGSAEVRDVFHITKVGTVAGAMVKEGKIKRSNKARLIRDGIVIFTGDLNALKRFKEDVKEVSVNYECGISLQNYNDIKVGDIIEAFEQIEIKKTL